MNLRSIFLATAAAVALANTGAFAQTPACRQVSVEGDATYCIQGPICSGAGDKPAGPNCPKVGDVAVKDCLKKLKSYTNADKCVAPVNAECKKIKTGAWGCVWGSSASAAAPGAQATVTSAPTTAKPGNASQTTAPTTAPTTAKPGNASQTTAPTAASTTGKPTNTSPTTAPAVQTTPSVTPVVTNAKPANCREVSVAGDATYCIQGSVCSGKGPKAASTICPKIGDVAVKDCLKTLKSWTQAGKCIAPVNAECKKGNNDVWSCVWGPAPTTAPVAQSPATTTAKPSTPATTAPSQSTPGATTAKPATPDATTGKPSTPGQTTPGQTTPAPSTPGVTTGKPSTPDQTTPAATTPAATTPAATTPAVTTPAVTTPAVTTPAVTTPAVTTPAVTTPAVTTPAVTTPAVTTPAVTTPAVTTPAVTTPAVTTPAVTTPAQTTPHPTRPSRTTPGPTRPSRANNFVGEAEQSDSNNGVDALAVVSGVGAAAAVAAAVFVYRRKQQQKKQLENEATLRNIITP